jgi:phenylacetic acid degradation operon negative regulatory protein
MTAVAETHTQQPPPRHLIVTVYGLYARSSPASPIPASPVPASSVPASPVPASSIPASSIPASNIPASNIPASDVPESGGWLSVAALIRLLADLGVDEPAVRSAISRLKRRGILQARRLDGAAGYELSAEALAILREGDARIFRRQRATLLDGWLLAVFSVPESQRQQRHVLRSELTRLGFGMAAPGVWIVPAHPDDATAEMLQRLGLDAYADLFHAQHLAFGDLTQKVRQWWDLDKLQDLYGEFISAHAPALARRQSPQSGPAEQPEPAAQAEQAAQADHSGREAFADYVRALTGWRRLPYLDPGLPAELLPADWIGSRAADLFFTLRSLLADPARAYVQQVTATPGSASAAGD